jgi:hypothetical protein
MRTHRPDPLLLLYLPAQEDIEAAFDALVAVTDAISNTKGGHQAGKKLRALLDTDQPEQVKEFIRRILDLHKERMERYAQSARRRLFTQTEHYLSALNNRAQRARSKP